MIEKRLGSFHHFNELCFKAQMYYYLIIYDQWCVAFPGAVLLFSKY